MSTNLKLRARLNAAFNALAEPESMTKENAMPLDNAQFEALTKDQQETVLRVTAKARHKPYRHREILPSGRDTFAFQRYADGWLFWAMKDENDDVKTGVFQEALQ